MIENKQAMAQNILKFMDRDNVKATDICKALHFKQNTFSDWVNAKTYPRIDAIEKLAQYFGVSKAALVEEHSPDVDFEITDNEKRLLIEVRKLSGDTQRLLYEWLAYRNLMMNKEKEDET